MILDKKRPKDLRIPVLKLQGLGFTWTPKVGKMIPKPLKSAQKAMVLHTVGFR